ncbi:MAG: tetratricopeptide repeat protein [Acidobacteria bacterium]|nr:tetratricopeptide repeat protein [Acidobacteriota bacterium]
MNEESPDLEPLAAPPDARLESWKDIAAYLKRDVRTVQRWEKLDGLPIYRHGPGRLGGVFAYKPELDGWWASACGEVAAVAGGDDKPPLVPSAEAVTEAASPELADRRPPRTMPRWRLGLVAAPVLVVVVAPLAVRWVRATFMPPATARTAAINFQPRDWVLIAHFDNHTGDAALDDVLESALERELANSRFVNVVPPERIEDALLLMKKPTNASIDAALGREICLRDGAIRALITGRVEKIGTRYLLSQEIVDPARGVVVGALSEETISASQILPAVYKLANGARAQLGETLQSIRASDLKLEKATTPSLRALRLYTQASSFMYQGGKSASAEALLRQAIADDPEFASAQILLAWTLRNQRHPLEEYLPYAERAMQLSDKTPERERYFIRGSCYEMLGNDADAIPAYEILVSLYPDHPWATGNLAVAYGRLGLSDKALPYWAHRAEVFPNRLLAQLQTATNMLRRGDPRQANLYAQRARNLLSAGAEPIPGFAGTEFFVPAYVRWLEGDLAGVVRELDAAMRGLDHRTENERFGLAFQAGYVYLTLGKLKQAEKAFQNIRAQDRSYCLAQIAFARGDGEMIRKYLSEYVWPDPAPNPQRGMLSAILAARVGSLPPAEKFSLRFAELVTRTPSGMSGRHLEWSDHLKAATGEIALRRGDPRRARALLEQAEEKLRGQACHISFSRQNRWPRSTSAMAGTSTPRACWKEPRENAAAHRAFPEGPVSCGCETRSGWRTSTDGWDARRRRARSRPSC